MSNFKYIILIFCLFSIYSCQNSKKHSNTELNNCIGKQLKLPVDLVVYTPNESCLKDSFNISIANFKIYSNIDVSCGSCLSEINSWNKFYNNKLKTEDIAIILICNSNDDFIIFEYLCENKQDNLTRFPFPFFYDVHNTFILLNNQIFNSQTHRAILTDRDNNILFIGDPLYKIIDQKKFISLIKK